MDYENVSEAMDGICGVFERRVSPARGPAPVPTSPPQGQGALPAASCRGTPRPAPGRRGAPQGDGCLDSANRPGPRPRSLRGGRYPLGPVLRAAPRPT